LPRPSFIFEKVTGGRFHCCSTFTRQFPPPYDILRSSAGGTSFVCFGRVQMRARRVRPRMWARCILCGRAFIRTAVVWSGGMSRVVKQGSGACCAGYGSPYIKRHPLIYDVQRYQQFTTTPMEDTIALAPKANKYVQTVKSVTYILRKCTPRSATAPVENPSGPYSTAHTSPVYRPLKSNPLVQQNSPTTLGIHRTPPARKKHHPAHT